MLGVKDKGILLQIIKIWIKWFTKINRYDTIFLSIGETLIKKMLLTTLFIIIKEETLIGKNRR